MVRTPLLKTDLRAARRGRRCDRTGAEGGFALLLVIWVLAVLSLLAGGLAADSRTEVENAHRFMQMARAHALAQAGVTLAIDALLAPDPADPWRADGTPRVLHYDDGTVAVSVQDEGGKIDINAAPLELIDGLLKTLHIADDERAALLRAIEARRSPPSRTGFATLSELRLIQGVSPRAYARISGFLTVYAASDRIDPRTAPYEVLHAVPGVTPQLAHAFIAHRVLQGAGEVEPLQTLPMPATANYFGASGARAVTITARTLTGAGATFVRRAIVAFGRPNGGPVAFLDWEQGDTADQSPASAP